MTSIGVRELPVVDDDQHILGMIDEAAIAQEYVRVRAAGAPTQQLRRARDRHRCRGGAPNARSDRDRGTTEPTGIRTPPCSCRRSA
jgi:CBS-domain-containing membrane protein